MSLVSLFPLLMALIFAPLLSGVINRTKAIFGGRQGQPLLQGYFDLWKLLQKGVVYSRTTTWIFRAGPIVGLASVLTAILLMPFCGAPAVIEFPGDLVLLACLLGLMRFFTVIGALDTGSSFEGMGASREVQFSALVEPALFLALAVVARKTLSVSLSGMLNALSFWDWVQSGPVLAMAVAALMVVLLAENARIPVDDPNTHLELTMIHEVMVLDYSGPDLAFVFYAAALKLWLLGSLVVGILFPYHGNNLFAGCLLGLGSMLGLAIVVGIIESCMARLRLVIVPQFLVGAGTLAAIALIMML